MKRTLLWIAGCLIVGVGGGLWYNNRPSAQEARAEATLINATPSPGASLVSKNFTNAGHKYTLTFFSDALVTKGKLATSSGQQAILARPGRTATSYVVFAYPLDNGKDSLRSDCGSRTPNQVAFSVNLYGSDVSVCHNATAPYSIYTLDVRATGTWEQITLFNTASADMTADNAKLKTILGSLKVD